MCTIWPAACLVSLAIACGPVRAQGAEIVVNPDLKEVSLDRDLLRAIFTMRLRAWPAGPAIRVFVLPDNDPVSDIFYREQLGMYTYVLRSAWDRMVFTGTGLAPTVVRSEKELRERVRATPGAIGFASKDPSGSMLLMPRRPRLAQVELPTP